MEKPWPYMERDSSLGAAIRPFGFCWERQKLTARRTFFAYGPRTGVEPDATNARPARPVIATG